MIKKLIKSGVLFISNPQYRIKICDWLKMYKNLSDKEYLSKMYYCCFGKKIDLDAPKTFNEKIQWLKLNDRRSEYTLFVDKYEIKNIISKQLGEEFIVPTYGVWNYFEEIDFSLLPNQFVLKTTHDSGGVVICRDKRTFDLNKAKKIINHSLKNNYYEYRREWPYKNVKPRIIAEMLLGNANQEIDDYKVHCFNGEPKMTLVCSDRHSQSGMTEDFYDNNWTHLNLKRPGVSNSKRTHKKPDRFEEMLLISKELSKNYPFLRVDFYVTENSIYIGELTLYPASGFDGFEPEEWDMVLGEWIDLSKEKMKKHYE